MRPRPAVPALAVCAAILATAPAAAPAAGPALLTRPAAAGRPYVGETVTLTPARWRSAADVVEREWLRCPQEPTGGCRPRTIDGETAVTYVIRAADIGATVYTAERAHDASGWSEWVTSNAPGDDEMPQGTRPLVTAGPPPGPFIPRWSALPQVTGTWRVGATLTADPGTWSPAADRYEYRWERCMGGEDGEECEVGEIAGATARTYVLTPNDAGTRPQVKVRAHGAEGWSFWAESLLEHREPVAEGAAGGGTGDGGAGQTTDGSVTPGSGTVTVRRLTVRPARFRPSARGGLFATGGRAAVTVTLSARPAAVRFRIERRVETRWVRRGAGVRVTPSASETTVLRRRLTGRVGARRLPAGRYRLRAAALDAAGRTSGWTAARFVITP